MANSPYGQLNSNRAKSAGDGIIWKFLSNLAHEFDGRSPAANAESFAKRTIINF
jgi:hypothetical protein